MFQEAAIAILEFSCFSNSKYSPQDIQFLYNKPMLNVNNEYM